jgi:putative Mn2+ efflux pump MntP
MNLPIILFTAVGLSMDAFAVAVAAGAAIREQRVVQALRIGGSFGFFQMVMPIIGWLLGSHLKQFITAFDHWIAFGLLAFIGLKMIHESFSGDGCDRKDTAMTNHRLLMLSIATSIDALAVGVGFAFLDYPIFLSALVIGVVTFLIATAGVFIGHICCCAWGKRAEFAGGVILILIGITILIEHLRA